MITAIEIFFVREHFDCWTDCAPQLKNHHFVWVVIFFNPKHLFFVRFANFAQTIDFSRFLWYTLVN